MAYVYDADIWCDACGRAIRNEIDRSGNAPADDEWTYDSDEYPKWADDDEEADGPQHCAAHEDCLNAHRLPSGRLIGCLIGTSLTPDGVEYVRDAVRDGGEVAEYWADAFSAYNVRPNRDDGDEQ